MRSAFTHAIRAVASAPFSSSARWKRGLPVAYRRTHERAEHAALGRVQVRQGAVLVAHRERIGAGARAL